MGYLGQQPGDDYLLDATADRGTTDLALPIARHQPTDEEKALGVWPKYDYAPTRIRSPGIEYFDGSGSPQLIPTSYPTPYDPQFQRYVPEFQGTGEAIAQGVAGAASSISHVLTDHLQVPDVVKDLWDGNATTAFQWFGNAIRNPYGVTPVPSFAEPQTPEVVKKAAAVRDALDKWIDSDKQNQGVGAQTIGGTVRGLATFGAGFAAGGPIGAAALVGSTSADDTYRALTAEGADSTTAAEAAFGQGVIGAASAAVPFKFGGNMLAKVFESSAINTGLGIAGRGANWAVLKANGYDNMAAMQRPLDSQALMAEALVGAGMGFAGHLHETYFGGREGVAPLDRPPPSQVDAARVAADQARAADMAPGVPTSPEAAALHHAIFSRVADDLANGRSANVTAEEARGIAAGTIPDPAKMETARAIDEGIQSDPIVQEANTMADALRAAEAKVDANVPDFAPPAGESGSAQRPQTLREATMAQLEAQHGAMPVETEDGGATTVANIVARMRGEIANAESDRGLMATAVACFARTGGVL